MKASIKRFAEIAGKYGGNLSEMARAIGVTRTTLYRWIESDSRYKDIVEEYRGRLLDKCLKTAEMIANGVPNMEETPNGPQLRGWKVYPDGQTLRFLISTLGKKEGFGGSIDVTSKGERIIPEPVVIEVIDKREQVEQNHNNTNK